MKIIQEKYPLLDFKTRQSALTNPDFKKSLYERIYKNNYTEDTIFSKDYEEFIADIAIQKHIKTYVIAHTVSDYLFQHSEKLMRKMWPFLPDISDSTGSVLWKEWTFFYRKFNDKYKGEDAGVFLYIITQHDKGHIGAFIKPRDGEIRGSTEGIEAKVSLAMCALFLPFLEFAECETKVINASTNKHAKLNKDKYFTDINEDIELVDSNWFTTIIRTEGFGVTGHFRLQPYGVGMQQRKMIWIKDFEKHGYTRRSHIEIKKEEEL